MQTATLSSDSQICEPIGLNISTFTKTKMFLYIKATVIFMIAGELFVLSK